MEIFKLFGSVYLEDNDVNRKLNELDNRGKNVAASFTGAGAKMSSFGGTLAKIGTIIASGMAIHKLVDFSKASVTLASNLGEVQNVVDTVFGESAEKINMFAQSAGVNFGLSELAAKKFVGTMGAMLDSMNLAPEIVEDMSQTLVGLAGDMASFYNLDAEETFTKLRSGISGETEPLKQLGINMSVANMEAYALKEGINKAWSEMTQAEQATLRYNYILETTANALGDFEKTSDSLANQQRILTLNMENLKATIGKTLMEAILPMMPALNGLISKFVEIVPKLMAFITPLIDKLVPVTIKIIDALLPVFIRLLEAFMPVLDPLIDIFIVLLDSALIPIIEQLLPLVEMILPVFTDLLKTLVPVIKPVLNILLELLNLTLKPVMSVLEALTKTTLPMFEAAMSGVESVIQKVSDAFSAVAGLFGGKTDVNVSYKEMKENTMAASQAISGKVGLTTQPTVQIIEPHLFNSQDADKLGELVVGRLKAMGVTP